MEQNPNGSVVRGGYKVVMTIREVARALKVSEKTAYKLVSSGELPYMWVRGVIRVPTESVIDYIKRGVENSDR